MFTYNFNKALQCSKLRTTTVQIHLSHYIILRLGILNKGMATWNLKIALSPHQNKISLYHIETFPNANYILAYTLVLQLLVLYA